MPEARHGSGNFRSRRGCGGGTIGLIVLLLCFAGWVVYRGVDEIWFPGEGLSTAEVEKWAHVRLPNGLRRIDAYVEGWQDTTLRARIEMGPEQVDTFLASTAATRPVPPDHLFFEEMPQHPLRAARPRKWWAPRASNAFRGLDGHREVRDAEGNPRNHVVWFVSSRD